MRIAPAVGSCTRWTREETALLDALIRERSLVHGDVSLFPGRTADAMHRKAAKRRVQLKLPAILGTRPRSDEPPAKLERPGPNDPSRWADGSAALHRATVRMCIRRGITLPGFSPAHTRAIAANLGIAA